MAASKLGCKALSTSVRSNHSTRGAEAVLLADTTTDSWVSESIRKRHIMGPSALRCGAKDVASNLENSRWPRLHADPSLQTACSDKGARRRAELCCNANMVKNR